MAENALMNQSIGRSIPMRMGIELPPGVQVLE